MLLLQKTSRPILFWCGLLCGLLLASPIVLRAERLPVRVFTSADGLGSSFVSSAMRDSRGFLWFCTRDGLSRFDGSRFVTYQVGSKNAPPGIEQIIETRKGVYWIATTGGLYRFDPNASPVVPKTNDGERAILAAEMVSTSRGVMYEDREGNLWIGANGLYRLDERNGKVDWQKIELNLPEQTTVAFNVSAFCEGEDGSLWIATNWGLLRRLPDGRKIFYSIDPNRVGSLASVLTDRGGRIWLASRTGIYILKPEPIAELVTLGALATYKLDAVAERQREPENEIHWPVKSGEARKLVLIEGLDNINDKYLYKTADDHIWIAGGRGPIEFDGQSFHPYTSSQGFPASQGQVVEDLSGNIWLGGPNGLARLNRLGLLTYDASDGLRESPINIITESRDGKLYAVSEGFFLSQFDGHSFQTVRPEFLASVRWAWTSNYAFLDSRNDWWFLTDQGLHRVKAVSDINALAQARPLVTYTTRDGLNGDTLFHIFEDSRNDLWISTSGTHSEGFGLSKWNRASEQLHTFSQADTFPPGKAPSAFAEDRGGSLWFGLYKGGLMRYRDGRFSEYTVRDGVPDGLITALHLDQSGRLWVASAVGGLSRIDDVTATIPTFVTYTIDKGLASNNVRSLTEDLYGNIYAGTARGIDRLATDGLHIKHYSVNDGLAGDFVYASFRDRQGVLWFGTSRGLSRLAPQQERRTSAPPVWLAGLRIAGESQALPELGGAEISNLELTHTQNNFQIDFFGIDFSASEALRYQYRLDGADRDWGAPTLQRTVNYANLAPGSYRFLVRAVNADGVASTQPATISFRVLPPIWQRWWFVALALCALGGVAYAAYRYRLAQLLKVERVRTRIATDLHDDIGASLSRMAILSEVVKAQRSSNGQQSDQMLTDIAESARGLVDSMGDIVWSIDPRRDDLQSVVQRIRQFASDVLEAKGIVWGLRIPPEVEKLKLDPEERQHLFLIFKESINNVARHGQGAKSVTLSIDIEGRQLIGEITDDGCGFTPQEPHESRSKGIGGNGLPNMRERATQLGGRLDIASAPGAGTRLTLKLPIR